MMRADAFNTQVNPVRTKMTGTQHIPILQVLSLDRRVSTWIIADKNLSKVYSTGKRKSESVIVDKRSTEESESESVHKSVNTNI